MVNSIAGKGDRYECPKVGRFMLKGDTTTAKVLCYVQGEPNALKALSKYIKNNQVKDGYVELNWRLIKDILKKAGVSTEGYRIR